MYSRTSAPADERHEEVAAGPAIVDRRRVEVFDISVEAPHTFFAGGFLVHNKTLREVK